MKEIALVFIGGGLGSVSRFLLSKALNPAFSTIPLGTLFSNIIACIIFGIIAGTGYHKMPFGDLSKQFIIAGFCGGLSTFSTFNYEIFNLLKLENYFTAALYIIVSITFCLTGFASANFIFSK